MTDLPQPGLAARIGPRLAAMLLGAAGIAWTASPLPSTGLARTALEISIAAVVAGTLRLAFAEIPQPEDDFLQPGYIRAWLTLQSVLRTVPWEEIAIVAVIWLEVQHPMRPWHTAVLGAVLTAYLLATHIAESGAEAAPLLRRQAKMLAVGACLLALAAGFAAIPPVTGAGAAILRVVAAVAVITATALVLPA